MAAGIVADCASNILRNGVKAFQKIFKRLGLKIGVTIESLVEVCDVGAMVFVVMNFHGLGINVGFECVESVRQRWDGKCHGFFLQFEIRCKI